MTIEEKIRDEDGWAVLTLYLETKNPDVETLVLATEQGNRAHQHRFHFHQAAETSVHLPPGKYLIQVVAREHRPASLAVHLEPDSVLKRTVHLETERELLATFEERLKAYGLSPKQAVERVELKERERRCVHNDEDQPGAIRLKAKTLKDVKRFIGAPFQVYDHGEPRFEVLDVPTETIDRLRKNELIAEDKAVLNKLVTEYLHGNEMANAQLMEELEPMLSLLVVGDFWFHAYNELTIPAGATYEFGPGTLVLDRLRIHTTGKLVPKGQCKFDIGHWDEFS